MDYSNQIFETEETRCITCYNSESKILFNMRWSGGKFKGINFSIVQCTRCGLVYLKPRILLRGKTEELYPDPEVKEIAITLGLRADPAINPRLGFKSKYLSFYSSLRNARILDFICRDGSFLEVLRERYGLQELYGTEIRPTLAKMASERGFKVILGSIEQTLYPFPNRFFDIIVMRHVIEHLYDPLGTLKEMRRILRDNGFLRIETPNIESLSKLLSNKFWNGFYIPWHLYYFSQSTLTRLLLKAGFQRQGVSFLPYPHYLLSPLKIFAELIPTHRKRRIVGKKLDDSAFVGALLFPINYLAHKTRRGDEIIVVCRKSH